MQKNYNSRDKRIYKEHDLYYSTGSPINLYSQVDNANVTKIGTD